MAHTSCIRESVLDGIVNIQDNRNWKRRYCQALMVKVLNGEAPMKWKSVHTTLWLSLLSTAPERELYIAEKVFPHLYETLPSS